MRVDIDDFHGMVCFIQLIGDPEHNPGNYICWDLPESGKTPVCGAGIIWLQLIPDGQKRVVTAIYLPEKKVVQGIEYSYSLSLCYVDVIEDIEYDTDGVAIFVDKYIDVCFTPQGEVIVDDRDELDDAYQSGELSKGQYDAALTECDLIIDELCLDIEKTETIFYKILAHVHARIEKGEKQFKERLL